MRHTSEEAVKKRGGHTRQRKYPGVKGRRPDKAAKRQEAAQAQVAKAPPKHGWEHPDLAAGKFS